MRTPIPLTGRPLDIPIVVFFVVNLLVVTYMIDLEQLVIADPGKFSYPLWPPAFMVDLVHWWGRNFDPVLMARPAWWRMTIWIDALLFGPFYAVATWAWVRGKDWIRIPGLLWAAVMLTNVSIILGEEFMGPHATPRPGIVFLANLAWIVFPVLVIARLSRSEHPFSTEIGGGTTGRAGNDGIRE